MDSISNKKVKNGLILIDKPADFTCQDVLSILKGVLHLRKIGHTGTLDRNATGLLVCLVGESTKYQDYFLNEKKKYIGELVIGLSTDTEDIYGEKISKISKKDDIIKKFNTVNDLYKKIDEVAKTFIGSYSQVPPMYSSKKVNGKTLLSYAKKGKVFERKPCDVYIHNIELVDTLYEKNVNGNLFLCIKIDVDCSKGTYIRTLCKDIGEKIGIPCCMGELRRINSDGFDIKNSYTLEDIKKMAGDGDYSFLKIALYNKYNQVVTFGKYDCVHLGHRKIMDEVVLLAKKNGYESSVLTFSINPKLLLGYDVNDNEVKNIITKEQRISYLKLYGINNILEFPFDEETKNMSGEEFVKNILIKQMKAKIVVVGDDCSYGKGGKCKSKDLIETCKKYNVEVKVINRLKIDDILSEDEILLLKEKNVIKEDVYISATLIRKILDADEKLIAYKLIGHNIDKKKM